MEKTLKIISPTEARELNPLGEKPLKLTWMATKFETTIEWDRWSAAEDSLKTYRILDIPEGSAMRAIEEKLGGKISHINFNGKYDIGTTHLCKVNDKDLTAIVL